MEEEANYEGSGNKLVRMAETEAQQMALLANASLLADELLPRAAMKLTPVAQSIYKDDPRRRPADRQNRNPEQREWKRRLASIVDRLKDSFCRQHALDLIFTEDGDSHLTADMYINMDGIMEEIEWFPSPIFQELYAKLYRMSGIASEMFVGRERFSTMLLMRLTETVILWLSEDQTFWDDIEEGPQPLGPLGLQQFYLDMKFVISFASQGRYLSRNLNRVVNEIINKALASFSATGVDPYGVLPEDEWFADICQEAMDRLSGKPRFVNGDRDLSSPTASVSAQSISSIRSHGSSRRQKNTGKQPVVDLEEGDDDNMAARRAITRWNRNKEILLAETWIEHSQDANIEKDQQDDPIDEDNLQELFGPDPRERPAGKQRAPKKQKSVDTSSAGGSTGGSTGGSQSESVSSLVSQDYRRKCDAAERAYEAKREKELAMMQCRELEFLMLDPSSLPPAKRAIIEKKQAEIMRKYPDA
ncbi:exocyst complex component EXO84B [Tanacetum coccineum]